MRAVGEAKQRTTESPRIRLGARWAVLICMLGLPQSSCERTDRPEAEPVASASVPVPFPERRRAGGTEEIALLDGLAVGDTLEGYVVTWIGAVRHDGAMEVRLEGGGRLMRLAVALDAAEPRPPVRTSKYALYFEGSHKTHAASEEDCLRVLAALAKRIRKVEAHVPTPSGMRSLPPRAVEM